MTDEAEKNVFDVFKEEIKIDFSQLSSAAINQPELFFKYGVLLANTARTLLQLDDEIKADKIEIKRRQEELRARRYLEVVEEFKQSGVKATVDMIKATVDSDEDTQLFEEQNLQFLRKKQADFAAIQYLVDVYSVMKQALVQRMNSIQICSSLSNGLYFHETQSESLNERMQERKSRETKKL